MRAPILLIAASVMLLLPLASQVCGAQARGVQPGADMEQVGPQRLKFDAASYKQVVYVSARGSDSNGDGSKDKPWRSVAKALESIKDAGPQWKTAVCVDQGMFPTQSVRLKPYVDVLGGFSGK